MSARAIDELPGLTDWFLYNLFGAFYPTLVMLVCMLAVTSGFSDLQEVLTAIGQVPFFSVLPVIGFSLLLTVVGDLIFAGRNPGYRQIIIMIFLGAILTPMVGIAAYLEAVERVTGIQAADSGYWAAIEAVSFVVSLLVVAALKYALFVEEAAERALAEGKAAQDNQG